MKKTIQKLYDKGLFDNNANADKVPEDFLFLTRRRGDLEKINDNVQGFHSKEQFEKQSDFEYENTSPFIFRF